VNSGRYVGILRKYGPFAENGITIFGVVQLSMLLNPQSSSWYKRSSRNTTTADDNGTNVIRMIIDCSEQ